MVPGNFESEGEHFIIYVISRFPVALLNSYKLTSGIRDLPLKKTKKNNILLEISTVYCSKLWVQHLLIKCDFSSKGVNPLWSKKH